MFSDNARKLLGIIQVSKNLHRQRSTSEPFSKIISNNLGINHAHAKVYWNKVDMKTKDPEILVKTINFCKEKLGLDEMTILRHPTLLKMKVVGLDNYYHVMTEGGFTVNAHTLSKFRTLCMKNINFLKSNNFINKDTNVAQSFIQHLTPRPDNYSVDINEEQHSWSDIHGTILIDYLKWRLGSSDDDLKRLLLTHPQICRKSFQFLCENIALAETLGFSPDKMLKYGYILHSYPRYTQSTMENYPEIAGISIKRAIRMFPKLMNVQPSNIEKIARILKEHRISDEAIKRRMNIFELSPGTVKKRLETLSKIPEFKALWSNPEVLKLVVHFNRAKMRLSLLKEQDLKCASLYVLGTDDNRFKQRVKEGTDRNTQKDIMTFVMGNLNKKIPDFKEKMKLHPFYLQVPLQQMEETYIFLKTMNISNDAICDHVYVLLYPKKTLQVGFIEVDHFQRNLNRHLTQSEKLNLLLYFIEKEHHFNGDGVWPKAETVEEITM